MHSRRDILKMGVLGGLGLSSLALWADNSGATSARSARASALRISQSELIELLERTPQEQVLDQLAPHVAAGIGSKRLLAAVFAAATRTVVPRSDFSKEHHILLCVHSMRLAQQFLPSRLGYHPALWAVDYFKWAQAEAQTPAAQTLDKLPSSGLPPADSAESAFRMAMETFDGPKAEAALIALHRAGARDRVVDNLLRYGSKDLRHIGHKAIHVAQGLATLDMVGWHGAEDALRSMAMTLALHYDEDGHDHDSAWTHSQYAIRQLERGWQKGRDSDEAVVHLLATLRSASPTDATNEVVGWLKRDVSAQSMWDAMLLSSAELMINNPTGVEALHAVTASNAAFAAFEASKSDETRRLLLLQNAARVADFHQYVAYWATKRKKPAPLSIKIEELEPLALDSSPAEALDEIFAQVGQAPDARLRAAQKTLTHLKRGPDRARVLGARAMEMALSRGTDTHDFKLPAAALTDHARVSPAWRARYLAACTARFRGTSEPRSALAQRIDEVT